MVVLQSGLDLQGKGSSATRTSLTSLFNKARPRTIAFLFLMRLSVLMYASAEMPNASALSNHYKLKVSRHGTSTSPSPLSLVTAKTVRQGPIEAFPETIPGPSTGREPKDPQRTTNATEQPEGEPSLDINYLTNQLGNIITDPRPSHQHASRHSQCSYQSQSSSRRPGLLEREHQCLQCVLLLRDFTPQLIT